TGCDYIGKAKLIDDLSKQQELQKSKIEQLEKQQEQDKRKIELFEKQQTAIISSTKTLASVVKGVKEKQDEFVFTEFNPAQTHYFILNNGSVG
ncbi:hypothetical protein OFL98_27675, partial [Escherichia coli]|nr:hypothetical protein [Escherichia coli]